MQGLVHITELSWQKVTMPEKVVALNEAVRCQVLSMDPRKGRITLSIKVRSLPWPQFWPQPCPPMWTLEGERGCMQLCGLPCHCWLLCDFGLRAGGLPIPACRTAAPQAPLWKTGACCSAPAGGQSSSANGTRSFGCSRAA